MTVLKERTCKHCGERTRMINMEGRCYYCVTGVVDKMPSNTKVNIDKLRADLSKYYFLYKTTDWGYPIASKQRPASEYNKAVDDTMNFVFSVLEIHE